MNEATKELDGKKRMAIYASLQRQMWERGPFVFLLQADEIAVMPKSVTGFLLGPTRSTVGPPRPFAGEVKSRQRRGRGRIPPAGRCLLMNPLASRRALRPLPQAGKVDGSRALRKF